MTTTDAQAKTLAQRLDDWVDVDVAMFHLAQVVGVLPHDVVFALSKGTIYASLLSDALYDTLQLFVTAKLLERRNEPDVQYRWKKLRPRP